MQTALYFFPNDEQFRQITLTLPINNDIQKKIYFLKLFQSIDQLKISVKHTMMNFFFIPIVNQVNLF